MQQNSDKVMRQLQRRMYSLQPSLIRGDQSNTNLGFPSAALAVSGGSTNSNTSPMRVAWGNSQLQNAHQRRAADESDEEHSSRAEHNNKPKGVGGLRLRGKGKNVLAVRDLMETVEQTLSREAQRFHF